MVAEHLKNKSAKNDGQSMIDFIDGAEKITKDKEAKAKPSESNILLSVSGRMARGHECEKKGFLLYLKKDTAFDINKHCHGNMQGILNYLVRRGLDSLIDEGELKLVME